MIGFFQNEFVKRASATVTRKYKVDKALFIDEVKRQYKIETGVQFNGEANNGEPEFLLNLLVDYWLCEESFFKNPLLTGGETGKINLKKGILIIGAPGLGKTSICSAFLAAMDNTPFRHYLSVIEKDVKIVKEVKIKNGEITYRNINRLSLSNPMPMDIQCDTRKQALWWGIKANNAVKEYEKYLADKENIFDKILNSPCVTVIDDLLAERVANNYGNKLETMQQILEDMEYRYAPFIFTCNSYGSSWVDTANKIKSRYGERAYDRLFSSLNFVEMKGESLRG